MKRPRPCQKIMSITVSMEIRAAMLFATKRGTPMIDLSLAGLMPLLPELFLAGAGLALLVIGVFAGEKATSLVSWLSVAAFAVAAFLLMQGEPVRTEALKGMFVIDAYAVVVKLLILAGLAVSVILSIR